MSPITLSFRGTRLCGTSRRPVGHPCAGIPGGMPTPGTDRARAPNDRRGAREFSVTVGRTRVLTSGGRIRWERVRAMSWLKEVLETSSSAPLPVTLVLSGAFAAAESGLGIGIAVPGETVVLVLAASLDNPAALMSLFVTVTFASSAGDHVGYVLGRRYGDRLRDVPLVRRMGRDHWDRAVRSFHRYGAWSVFLTRLLPVVRTLTPATAGVAGVRYRRFLPASLAGAALWSALYVVSGALVRASVDEIGAFISRVGWGVLVCLVAATCLLLLFRRRRGAARAPE